MHRQVLAHLPAIADPPQKLDEHAHPPPDRCHRARRLAQNYFLFSPKRGNFSLHCSVPPQILSNQLQSNGLEQGSASLISESGLIIPSCVHRGSPLVPRRRSKKVVGAKRLWTAAAYRRFGPASLLARKGRSPRRPATAAAFRRAVGRARRGESFTSATFHVQMPLPSGGRHQPLRGSAAQPPSASP